MTNQPGPSKTSLYNTFRRLRHSSVRSCVIRRTALLVLLGSIIAGMATMGYTQTYSVIYSFSGKYEGNTPYATLTLDHAGNLYGTAFGGGQFNNGTAFHMMRQGSEWVFDTLWLFPGLTYGSGPDAPMAFGPDGALYGTTIYGGNGGAAASSSCWGRSHRHAGFSNSVR